MLYGDCHFEQINLFNNSPKGQIRENNGLKCTWFMSWLFTTTPKVNYVGNRYNKF